MYTLYDFEDALEYYISNWEKIHNHTTKFDCFAEIEYYINSPTKNEYSIIAGAALEAWLHTDTDLSASAITAYISEAYAGKKCTLEEIKYAGKREILDGIFNNDIEAIRRSGQIRMQEARMGEELSPAEKKQMEQTMPPEEKAKEEKRTEREVYEQVSGTDGETKENSDTLKEKNKTKGRSI